jgi:HD-GYP domain-containing protein (c-di-GMP phosphodiesterase class II)
MKLLQLCAGQIRLNQPLPWNVRTGPGELLLGKGQVLSSQRQLEALLERGMYVDEEEYERHRKHLEAAAAAEDPFYIWTDLVHKLAPLLRQPQANPDFQGQVRAIAEQLSQAIKRDADLGNFELRHMERVGYPVLHSLQTAFLCKLVSARLGLSNDETLSLLCASLTMNIAMLDLQQALCMQTHPLSEVQRTAIQTHAERSMHMLNDAGVSDAGWLEAVRRHHGARSESEPSGHDLAAIVQHADVYLAKLSSRQSRPAMPVHEAARSFFMQQGGAMNPIAAAIIKEMGIYPPGSYVKLANGETAVVVRRGESANTPQVFSLSNAQGIAFAEPVRRDTRNDRFRVLAPVSEGNVMVRFDRTRLFRSAA